MKEQGGSLAQALSGFLRGRAICQSRLLGGYQLYGQHLSQAWTGLGKLCRPTAGCSPLSAEKSFDSISPLRGDIINYQYSHNRITASLLSSFSSAGQTQITKNCTDQCLPTYTMNDHPPLIKAAKVDKVQPKVGLLQ